VNASAKRPSPSAFRIPCSLASELSSGGEGLGLVQALVEVASLRDCSSDLDSSVTMSASLVHGTLLVACSETFSMPHEK
jgi:hypothetical protein